MNPQCEIQVAMARTRAPEPDFYRRVTGEEYDREFGERVSARRRGAKFEQNLHQNGAALLRGALAEFVGVPAERIYVRNLDDEIPGAREGVRVARYRRTLNIVSDSIDGRRHPEVIVHPELLLPVAGTNNGYIWVEPDFMAWDGGKGIYVPGDEKSFIVQDNEVDPGDLERTRLQIAAQIIALRHLYSKHAQGDRVAALGLLVFATPYGLSPHAPRLEHLDGAVHAIRAAIQAFARHGAKIDRLRAVDSAPMHLLVNDLEPHFQERCVSDCVLAHVCRRRHVGSAADLGDHAADLLGSDADTSRLADLIAGAPPRDDAEATLASELRGIADLLGLVTRAA